MSSTNLDTLRDEEYRLQLEATKLRRQVFEQPDPTQSSSLLRDLIAAEKALAQVEKLRATAHAADVSENGTVFSRQTTTALLGPETTGLDAHIQVRMAQVPTAIYHLLSPDTDPLLTCFVDNVSTVTRRLRISSFIDGYSSRAVDTVELNAHQQYEFRQSPTLFPKSITQVTELTRATLNVEVEDLDGRGVREANWTEVHKTHPIWLLARTSAPVAVRDPVTGRLRDMTRYFGAFVTPNAPPLMSFLRTAAATHPERRLVGYQGDKTVGVHSQVKALFDALKTSANITYVNSIIAFNPEEGQFSQRVRLPRESLQDQQANCIDGTVLFASLLEGASLNPAIVVVPGHAFVAWETWDNSGEWDYLETTMIGSDEFDAARQSGASTAEVYETLAKETNDNNKFRRWSLRELRTIHRITPME
jgi:hypothetical protein